MLAIYCMCETFKTGMFKSKTAMSRVPGAGFLKEMVFNLSDQQLESYISFLQLVGVNFPQLVMSHW